MYQFLLLHFLSVKLVNWGNSIRNILSLLYSSTTPFDILHIDVWGPSSVCSIDGYKYYLSIVDYYTRFTWIFLMTVKSKVLAILLSKVLSQFQKQVKHVQCDNGDEFVALGKVLSQLGVGMRFTCPYSHQQNGLVERKDQHITEIDLSLLAQSSLPMKYEWHAFQSATYLINLLPSSVIHYSNPHLMLYNKNLDYTSLKIFGYACFPFLRPYNSSKLQFRSSKCIFLGYCSSHKGYYCLHPSGRIYISPTVEFNETKFPYKSLFSSHISSSPLAIPHHTKTPAFPSTQRASPGVLSQPHSNTSAIQFPNSYSPLHTSDYTTNELSQTSSSSTSSNPISSFPPTVVTINHPMTTRVKSGIYKPKVYQVSD